MLWIHASEGSRFEMWTNVSDVVVVWFASGKGEPNEAGEVTGRALRQGALKTFASTEPETIRHLRAAMNHAPWVAVQSPREGWEKFVSLERVSDVRRLPASPAAPDGPQKLLLTLTYDSGTQTMTETLGEIFDPAEIDAVMDHLTRSAPETPRAAPRARRR